ncbi:Pr6Pr family membrane protein [Frateuria defendens]|uniref:Pr6Pr family membrane protein n=1 Tax=Frateuria defendens TaxID=2219559 RepID=UPI00066FC2B4|nr:Pr6Pr family membrane protein [Frateuria defendens]
MPTPHHRALAGALALLGWAALTLQLGLSIRLTEAGGRSAWHAVWVYAGYFTILTNALVAWALSAAALEPRDTLGRFLRRPDVQTGLAMSIVIVGAVYNLLLRQLWHPQGWQRAADATLHDAMPPLYLLYWWLAVPKASLRWRQVFAWQLYPVAYFAYALARGAVDGWYPYPFLDVGALGYARVLLNACAVLLAFVAVALLLVASGRWQARRRVEALVAEPGRP